MLKCCDSDGEIYLFLSFFAVGNFVRALFFHAVKGGVSQQKCIFAIFKVLIERFSYAQSFHSLLYTTVYQIIFSQYSSFLLSLAFLAISSFSYLYKSSDITLFVLAG